MSSNYNNPNYTGLSTTSSYNNSTYLDSDSVKTTENFGNGKIDIDISELRKIKAAAERLIDELNKSTNNILAESRAVASSAASEYSTEFGTGVMTCSKAVLNQCAKVSQDNITTLGYLSELAKGIDKVIEGYQTLEQKLSTVTYQ